MKAFMIEDTKFADFIEVEEPKLKGPLSVKVAVESIGICGTDIKIMKDIILSLRDKKEYPDMNLQELSQKLGKM